MESSRERSQEALKEILKKVKLLEINTRKLVNNIFVGEYHTAFKGQGMTFSEFREYVPGDDVRSISWIVTARTGKPHIKKYDEERELTLMLAVDVSGSVNFGSGSYLKDEVLIQVAALLAFSAVRNQDHVGLLLFSDQIEHYVPPKKGRGHVQRILRDLLFYKPKSKGTNMTVGLQHLLGMLKKRSTIFVLSDFLDGGFDRTLRQLGQKHDTVAVVVDDPLERKMPPIGLIDFEDSETGEVITVDTSNKRFRKDYESQLAAAVEARNRGLRLAQVGRIDIHTSQDVIDPLVKFFRSRHRA